MRTLLGLAAATGLACLTQGAAAAPLTVPTNTSVQPAQYGYYYGCGPECQRHRYWAHRRWEREQAWQYRHSYGYNYGYAPYYRGY
jgi:hypothetical protein